MNFKKFKSDVDKKVWDWFYIKDGVWHPTYLSTLEKCLKRMDDQFATLWYSDSIDPNEFCICKFKKRRNKKDIKYRRVKTYSLRDARRILKLNEL